MYIMKKPVILGFFVLALSSFAVLADSQYPAADFQPQVIYLDKNVTTKVAEPTAEVDAKFPAANFQPILVYSANPTTTAAKSAPTKEEFDPKYPAAHFQPKVIYP
jgi:hypothetical protein